MTFLVNHPADFADQAVRGMVAANGRYLRMVHGGVVRSTKVDAGQVGVVVGGGSGHYPAFAGWVGPGLAHGSACGNIFASPSATQVYSVLKACDHGGGLLLSFGNYAGDVLHFGQAADRIRAEGVDVRIVTVTDDIASAPAARALERRGIAGDLVVFKCAGAAAEEGASLDEVERVARRANERTRTFGIAFAGCTLPGADHPLFSVPEGRMSLGLGIHGEPGIAEQPLGTADEIAALLVEKVTAEDPGDATGVVAILNGLGTVKYEELYVCYDAVSRELHSRGYQVVDAEVGEHCTSLDMAGLSLTLIWLDDELERLWAAPCDTPAYRKGVVAAREIDTEAAAAEPTGMPMPVEPGSQASRALAERIAAAVSAVHEMLAQAEEYLGEIDSVAGDGDHGIGMLRGAAAADETAQELVEQGAGAATLLSRVAESWAERSGGSSGAFWGAAIGAAAGVLDDQQVPGPQALLDGAIAGVDAILTLGGAQVGDKTMVDAAIPFRDTLAAAGGQPLAQVWARAVDAAAGGTERTKEFAARRGRARTHQDKSIGTPDPGAVSFTRIVAVVGEQLGDAVAVEAADPPAT